MDDLVRRLGTACHYKPAAVTIARLALKVTPGVDKVIVVADEICKIIDNAPKDGVVKYRGVVLERR